MKNLEQYIFEECSNLIKKYEYRVRHKKYYVKKFEKRTGVIAKQPNYKIPDYWSNNHFNPYYVKPRSKSFAHSILTNIRNRKYKLDKVIEKKLPKYAKGFRKINIFAVQDKAVAKYLTDRLENRYNHLLSSYAYAYRKDKKAHHAIEHINRYIRGKERLYFIKVDFKNYFDNISHKYIFKILNDEFGISNIENELILSFLKSSYVKGESNYNRSKIFKRGVKGLPQGNCLSNFLSNLASWEMDRKLELAGVCLARYADDCIILCKDYFTANKAMNIFLENNQRASVEINFEKSEGIRLFTNEPNPEFPSIQEFDFLGHKFIENKISISDKSIKNMKKKLSKIMYRVLLKYPKKNQFSKNRINSKGIDLDMIDCIKELRNYIYGKKLSEKQLSNGIQNSNVKLVFSNCALSYYPLVDNYKIFHELDGWLLNTLIKTQRYRYKLLQKTKYKLPLRIYTSDEFINGTWNPKNIAVSKLPSFYRSWQYTRKCLKVFGLIKFPNPTYS